ncbi:hypothetical protein CF319_g2395 [Tilletia indica]|nr:hypothetical protein CF319_g2395 [Tilletia indica]
MWSKSKEVDALIPSSAQGRVSKSPSRLSVFKLILVLLLVYSLFNLKISVSLSSPPSSPISSIDDFLKCSIDNLDKSALDQPLVEPIPFEEFVERRDRIAGALVQEGLDAYIVEPGYDFRFLANLSGWEDWGPTERPFLLVIQPLSQASSSNIHSRSTILTPKFELTRAKQLVLPFHPNDAKHLPWREEESPYDVLASFLSQSTSKKHRKDIKIKVGPETRTFISQGLALAGLEVVPYSETEHTAAVRQSKSDREVAIMRAANTLTVEAIRSVRKCAYDGLSELEMMDVFKQTMLSASPGIADVEGLTLFGERAACPHCGPSDTRRLNAREDFILMDVGARLYGYISDCTRTFLLPNSTEEGETTPFDPEKLKIWYKVHEAQSAAINAIREGTPLHKVDHAARRVIEQAGYGKYFIHRLGHSIGLQMHEPPYATGNSQTTLKYHTPLTAEPGIYIEGYAGVRLEDVILTNGGGKEAETLTNRRATSPWDP